jgi:hypothetical protein
MISARRLSEGVITMMGRPRDPALSEAKMPPSAATSR